MEGVRYVSWAGHGGYPASAQGYLRALVGAGIPVEWIPLLPVPGGWAPSEDAVAARDQVRALEDPSGDGSGDFGPWVRDLIGAVVPDGPTVLHSVPELWPDHRSDRSNIGLTTWETDRLPSHWPDLLNDVDRIVVPSRFNAGVFAESGVDRPIGVVPHVLPTTPPSDPAAIERLRARLGIRSDDRVVYCVDAWNARKAPWTTIATFARAFTPADDVVLVLKTTPRGPTSATDPREAPTATLVDDLLARLSDPPRVVVVDDHLTAAELGALHRLGACYLSMSHGEGFGLGPFQAAAAGNPVILAGWGAPREYLTGQWPYLLDHEMMPVIDAAGRGSYEPHQRWASPDADQAVELLRDVIAAPTAAAARVSGISERIRGEYTADAIAPRLIAALS